MQTERCILTLEVSFRLETEPAVEHVSVCTTRVMYFRTPIYNMVACVSDRVNNVLFE